MPTATSRSNSLAAAASSAIAIGLMFAPPSVTKPIRTRVRDAARPGQALAQTVLESVDAALKNIRPLGQTAAQVSSRRCCALESSLNEWKRRCRRLQAENVLLHEKLRAGDRAGISLYQPFTGQPLIVPQLIESSVLGRERSAVGPAGLLIDKGSAAEVLESLPVLAGDGPVIDQGADAFVTADQPVYSAQIVVGKIAGVGRWTSTVRLVTDRNYRGPAQLVRETSRGVVAGADGVLEGLGEKLCRLTRISSNAQVRVGDEVYTTEGASTLPYPMYYGKVVKARLTPDALEWDIRVKPAVDETKLQSVQILRTRLNPLRVTEN